MFTRLKVADFLCCFLPESNQNEEEWRIKNTFLEIILRTLPDCAHFRNWVNKNRCHWLPARAFCTRHSQFNCAPDFVPFIRPRHAGLEIYSTWCFFSLIELEIERKRLRDLWIVCCSRGAHVLQNTCQTLLLTIQRLDNETIKAN